MKQRRERIAAVLRVREIQKHQAAMEVATAVQAANAAEATLDARLDRYRDLAASDVVSGDTSTARQQRLGRVLQADAIVHARADLAAANAVVADRQAVLVRRSQAVRGLEKLDEGIAEVMAETAQRSGQRATDDLTTSTHVRGSR